MSSFLIFGRSPNLSLAELYQRLGGNDALLAAYNREAVIVADEKLGQSAPLSLGGVVKSGVVIAKLSELTPAALAELLIKEIVSGQKFHFGLSFYGLMAARAPLTLHVKHGAGPIPLPKGEGIKRLGLEVKKVLKEQGASVRLVESRHENLSAADVVKNKLAPPPAFAEASAGRPTPSSERRGVSKGIELCLFKTAGGFLVGRTLAVQPYEDYSERDYGRPAPDPRVGMLPPKLARMMVNIAAGSVGTGRSVGTGQDLSLQILDPFCGSGTILQEALLLGHKIIGTDIDEDVIRNAKKNLGWLLREHRADWPDYRIEPLDVRSLDQRLAARSIEAVVTECDLGPPLSGTESADDILEIEKDLSALYTEALKFIHFVLRDDGRAVLAWPYFTRHDIWVSIFEQLDELGWELTPPYPAKYEAVYPLSGRSTLLYGRPDQHVWREILILKKSQ